MKPMILGSLNPLKGMPKEAKKAVLSSRSSLLGEVFPTELPASNPYIRKLLAFADDCNFTYRKQNWYTGSCVTPLAGTIPWHVDEGIGLLLCWLVSNRKFRGLPANEINPMLLSWYNRRVEVVDDIKVGDVFIFDGSKHHAWESNSHCILIQTTVKRKRQ